MGAYFTDDELRAVLNTPMGENDANAQHVREYFFRLLQELWDTTDCFSGKRPFGNSSWDHEVYYALAAAGVIEGAKDVFDPDDEKYGWEWEIADAEYRRADSLILHALRKLMLHGDF